MTGEELRLAETEQRARSNSRRIDRLEARQDETDKLVAAMASLRSEQSYIKQDVAEIKEDVKQLALISRKGAQIESSKRRIHRRIDELFQIKVLQIRVFTEYAEHTVRRIRF